jgi:hypothetical protein
MHWQSGTGYSLKRSLLRLGFIFSRGNWFTNANFPAQSEDEPFQVVLSDESFETYELDPPSYTIEVTKKELKKMYYDMVSIRYD